MTDKLLLHKVNVEKQTVEIDGTEHAIKEEAFPTVNFDSGDIEDVYQLSEEEEQVMEGLRMAFVEQHTSSDSILNFCIRREVCIAFLRGICSIMAVCH